VRFQRGFEDVELAEEAGGQRATLFTIYLLSLIGAPRGLRARALYRSLVRRASQTKSGVDFDLDIDNVDHAVSVQIVDSRG